MVRVQEGQQNEYKCIKIQQAKQDNKHICYSFL